MNQTCVVNPFLLVDGALANESNSATSPEARPSEWLHAVWRGSGNLLGPLVIDIAAASSVGQTDEMMRLVNAMRPQCHLSYIETSLSSTELVRHFQQFNVIRTEDGRLFNLRLSDCIALAKLAQVLSPAQWATLTGPLTRWSIHCRDGQSVDIECTASPVSPLPVPLTLTELQMLGLAELGAPDVMLANIRSIRHFEPLPGSASQQHRWASEARQLWKTAENGDELVLRWITAAALDTNGLFLSRADLPSLLAKRDPRLIKSAIENAIGRA